MMFEQRPGRGEAVDKEYKKNQKLLMYPSIENVKHDGVILWNVLHDHQRE